MQRDPTPDVFRTLFAAYADALIVVDGAGRIVLANPSRFKKTTSVRPSPVDCVSQVPNRLAPASEIGFVHP